MQVTATAAKVSPTMIMITAPVCDANSVGEGSGEGRRLLEQMRGERGRLETDDEGRVHGARGQAQQEVGQRQEAGEGHSRRGLQAAGNEMTEGPEEGHRRRGLQAAGDVMTVNITMAIPSAAGAKAGAYTRPLSSST